jgi:pimeloyl-ACP methyl ester carboxylesterase
MQTQYFQRPEGTLAYTDYGGQGELVLMLPGVGALRSEYRYLAPQLVEAGYHAVAVDLRGQGESSVPWEVYDVPSVGTDILALIEHLNAGPAHLIGTSFSPGAIVWATAERSQCVRSLILIGAFVRDARLNPLVKAMMWLMFNGPWRAQAWGAFYRRIYPTRKPADFEDYMAKLVSNIKQPGRFDALIGLVNSSRQPSEERLARVHAPMLVVMGTKDPDFPNPVAEAEYIASQTGGTVALIEEAGHYPQTEMPEKTTPVILDFLKTQVKP